ncbi:MAG: GNAT family N-acetyltransferase [Vicinamibacteria bacterium]
MEIVTQTARLAEIGDEWRELAERRGNAFLTPEWFFAWIDVVGDAATPLVAVRRDAGGELAGVMPLVGSGRGPRRTVRFAGAAIGDLFSPLDRESDRALSEAAIAAIRATGERGAFVFDRVEPDAEWVQGLAAGPETVTELADHENVLPEVDLAGLTWEEYLAGRSRNLRSQLGRRRRKLEREHEIVFRRSDSSRLAEDPETWRRLHQARWADRGGGALDPQAIAFHARFSAAILERGWLRLWILEADERPVAAWYGWLIGGRYSYYLAGFDDAFADYSIGTLLLAWTIEDAIEEGASVYEMLLGSEPFKLRFATGQRRVHTVIVSPRLHPIRAAALGESAARRLVNRLEPTTRARIKRPIRALANRLSGSRP